MKLTSQYLRSILEYKDGDLYWKVSNSNRVKVGDVVAPTRKDCEVVLVGINGKEYRLHRLIYLYFNEDFDIENKDIQIDHIDINRSNNKIENLRIANNKQNNCNKNLQKNNTSGFRGVKYYPEGRKKCWFGYYKVDGKMFGKYFLTQTEAMEFAEHNRKIFHGEFYNNILDV